MIRILQVVSNMDRAGIETMLMNYYRHIDRTKIQFDFLCNKKKPGAYDDEIKELGGKIYHTPGLNPFKYIQYLKYMRKLFAEHPEYNIIHAHNDAFVAYSLFAAKRNKIKERIAHVHSAAFTFDYKWPLKVLCRPIIPHLATKKCACGTEAARFYYGKKVVDNGEVLIINNAIEIEKFIFNKILRGKIRQEYDLNGKFVIGHIGRFDVQKNHTFLIDVFNEVHKKNKDAVLLLLGDGQLEKEIKSKVEKLGLNNCVIFIGNVSNANEFYQAMDVFVLPSVWEGLPVVGIEAQTADLPCVFSDDITSEVGLLPTSSFLKRSDSLDIWADEILKHDDNRQRMDRSEEIRNAGFDINVESNRLMELYMNLY